MQHEPIIHIVDDDELFREALFRQVKAAGYHARSYSNAGDFLLARVDEAPGCIPMDLRMPGPSGLDLQDALASHPRSLPIIFMTGFGDIPTTVRAIKAGAVDFLTKPIPQETLFTAIGNALARHAECHVNQQQLSSWRSDYEALTPREIEVFERVVAGKMNKEIAGEIGAAERTVKAHRAHVMEKMHANSLAELVHIADQLRASGISSSGNSARV